MKMLALLALALVTFGGTLLDRTTQQPLIGVYVQVTGPSTRHATTDAHGTFAIANLKPGNYNITVQSRDVPQQHFHLRLTRNTAETIHACSTTLDYHCGSPGGGPGI